LASAAPEGIEKEFIVRRLNKYGYTGDGDIESIVEYAVNWVRDMGKPPSAEVEIEINEVERKALEELIKEISKLERGEDIQTAIFDISRKFGISPRRFFKILYQIILGRDRGPRLGPLIEDMGVENVIKRFSEALE
jgi:lysyl-tRNA synthetase class 1